MSYNIRLLISCPDKQGLIAAISSFIAMHDGNILSADQYVSDEGANASETSFMRLEIEGEGFGLERDEFGPAFPPLARQHKMDWRVYYTDTPKRMAILVSGYDHCLLDLLWRWEAGELDARYRWSSPTTPTSAHALSITMSPSTTCQLRKKPRPIRNQLFSA